MTSIRKVVIDNYQATDRSNLKVITDTIPPPSQGQVQCEVLYAGFNGADANMLRGWYPMQKAAPITPGYCFVGRVKLFGPGCKETPLKVGDLVLGLTVYDSEADLVNYPEDKVHHVPEGVDAKTACALTLDWYTALGMVKRAAQVKQGQRVFVHGLSGAVGVALGTLCKMRGAVVYGTASPRNHKLLEDRGFEAFDYRDKAWIQAMQDNGGAHAVFDPLGFESFDESYSILSSQEPSILVGYGNNLGTLNGVEKPRSVVYSVGKLLSRKLIPFTNKTTTFFYITPDDKGFAEDIAELGDLVRRGEVQVPIKKVYELEDIKKAHEEWGKLPGLGSLLILVKEE